MEMTRSGYAVIYVILLCALAKEGSEGKRWDLHQFLNEQCHFSSPSSLFQDGNKLEQAWKHCRKELVERKHGNQEFEDILRKAIEFLPTQSQQNLLHCISTKASNNAPVSLPHSSASPPSFTNFLTSGCERHLLADSPDDQIPPTTPSSASPSSSPSPSPSSPSPSPGLAGESPSHDTKPPYESPSHDDTKPSDSPSPPSPPKSTERPPPMPLDSSPPPPQPNKNNEPLKLTFIAAVTVSAIAALILICLCWGAGTNKVDPKQAQKGADGAGITLVSADIFYGGPPKSVVLEKFDKNESATNGGGLISNSEGGSLITTETASLLSTGQIMADPPLKPPPGKVAPRPPQPPPPAAPHAPPPPPPKAKVPPVPRKPIQGKNKAQGNSSEGGESDAPKPKLKPFFWDKVNKADQGMVWQQINQGSFQFNEEMIESLFGCGNQNSNQRKKEALEPAIQFIQIIDPRKAQNLSILLRALNVTTEEVVDALKEGSDVPCEIIHALLRMTLTADEELKLRLYTGDLNQLGPAERFLKVVVDIPFAFKRLESLMLMTTFTEEVSSLKESFATLEVACNNLRKSRLFLKLLEAVLKTGNRMNDGTYRGGAQAFKLDTLLKLSDVKGTDGRTTLLHFVVQEIIRSEGIRAVRTQKASRSSGSSCAKTEDLLDDANEDSTAEHYRRLGLQVVSELGEELEDVKKAAIIDGEGITSTVSKLGQSLLKSKEFLNNEMKSLDEDLGFPRCLESFVEKAESEIAWLREEDKRIMALVKSTGDYFHGTAEKDEGLRLFTVVRDFLIMLDKACKEVQNTNMKSAKASKYKESPTAVSPVVETRQPNDLHRRLFPAIAGRRMGFSDSSDDDESSSSSSP